MNNYLDLVFGHASGNLITNTSVSDIAFSDHRLISFDDIASFVRVPVSAFTYRKLKEVNINIFESELPTSDIFLNAPSLFDENVTQQYDDIIRILDTLAPTKTKTIRSGVTPTAIWMTTVVRNAKRLRHRLER